MSSYSDAGSGPVASSDYDTERFEIYRALSKAAVTSAICSLVGLTGLLFPLMLVLPAAGFVFGVIGLLKLRRYRNELTGFGLALVGTLVSTVVLVGGSSWHVYAYANEVPEGYQRLNWYQLRGEDSQPINAHALEIKDKPVFVKGYVHPGVDGFGEVKSFVLVPDMKTCCFGGQPKPWDMIEVTLGEKSNKIRYSRSKRGLWGVFRVEQPVSRKIGDVRPGFYKMTTDDLR
ncbi:MAG: hypothetical protein VB877_00975 [Pirellulaceae bacterium]